MPPSPLPPNVPSTVSFWRASPHRLDDYRSTPEIPAQVDICVIGAGYAGASTVYHILDLCKAKGQTPPSIVILEARQACSGATGRNGGHMKPDVCSKPSKLAVSHGIDVAAEFAAFELQNLYAVKKVVENENIDCDFALTRAVDALMSDSMCTKVKDAIDMLREKGLPQVNDVYFANGEAAESLSGVKGAKGCVSYSAGHLSPYKFVLYLLSKAVEAGVNLQTHTPVTEVTNTPDADGLFAVTTSRGLVRAKNIVYATNAYTSSLLPEFADKIIPVRGICSHIKPTVNPAPHLPNSSIIRWSDSQYEYLISRLDGSIIVGGGRSQYYHDLGSWYGNVDDGQLIESAKTHFDGYMQRMFHGWENSGAHTSRIWTGIMGYSSDGMPHVGKVPGQEKQFILAGFTGHGMPQIFLSAKGVASMLLDQAAFSSTGIPKDYQTTQVRLDDSRNRILESWQADHKN